jgi:hypothetical protein
VTIIVITLGEGVIVGCGEELELIAEVTVAVTLSVLVVGGSVTCTVFVFVWSSTTEVGEGASGAAAVDPPSTLTMA